MAKNSISDYDTTAANNTDIQSTDISEGCPASGINNAIREMMADTADAFTQGTPIALDQTNNRVGIGTTSPARQLTVSNSSAALLLLESTGDDNGQLLFGDSADGTVGKVGYAHSTNHMFFNTNGSEQMRIDAGGSMLLGSTTPTDLHNTWRHIIVGDKGAIISQDGAGGVAGMTIADNAYVDADTGGYAYQTTDQASKLTQEAGVLTFSNAASGTAGAALSLSEQFRIDASGNVGVAPFSFSTTTGIFMTQTGRLLATCGQDAALALSRRTNNGPIAVFYRDTSLIGNISITTSSVSYNTTSDHRAKENVADMTGAIDRVKALAPKRFNFIVDPDTTVDGFLAHEAQTVVPEAVTGTHNEVDDDGNAVMQGIDQSKLVPLLTGALQEAITKIETLETEMTALKARVTALEA